MVREADSAKNAEIRKYAMTRIDSGDYLLPSNDGRGLWRISRYWEDGSASWIDHRGTTHPIRGTFWQIAKLRGPLPEHDALIDGTFLDWSNWEEWETGLLKRKYAVEAALNADARASDRGLVGAQPDHVSEVGALRQRAPETREGGNA